MADAWGVSWGGTFIVWGAVEQVTAPNYGPPFIDLISAMGMTIGVEPGLRTEIGLASVFPTTIEARCKLPSARISRGHGH